MKICLRLIMLSLLGGVVACSKGKALDVGDLPEGTKTQTVKTEDLWDKIPAYGLAVQTDSGLRFEVNIEAEDAPALKLGQKAEISEGGGNPAVDCRVVRVVRSASEETDQALAWLAPESPSSVLPGQFVQGWVQTALKRKVLALPRSAVLVRDGSEFVIVQGSGSAGAFAAREVKTGISSDADVEISSGLKAGDVVVVQGGLGLLYPDFKAVSGD